MAREFLIASGNRKKLLELERLCAQTEVRVRSLGDLTAAMIAPLEDGATFAANAALKARSYARQSGLWTLADDSGLAVCALNGAPGVYSARYAGEGASDAQNQAKLMAALAAVPSSDRLAAFHCALAFAAPSGEVRFETSGVIRGKIALAARGTNGFGYDPIFIPDGEERTFAEMTATEKDAHSHRGQALKAFMEWLLPWSKGEG